MDEALKAVMTHELWIAAIIATPGFLVGFALLYIEWRRDQEILRVYHSAQWSPIGITSTGDLTSPAVCNLTGVSVVVINLSQFPIQITDIGYNLGGKIPFHNFFRRSGSFLPNPGDIPFQVVHTTVAPYVEELPDGMLSSDQKRVTFPKELPSRGSFQFNIYEVSDLAPLQTDRTNLQWHEANPLPKSVRFYAQTATGKSVYHTYRSWVRNFLVFLRNAVLEYE